MAVPDESFSFEPGDLVRRRTTGEVGVFVRMVDDGIAEVTFPSGRSLVPAAELEFAERDPAEQLLDGDLGSSEPFSLYLQARFLKHAYRFDPLSGLSNARIEPTLHQVYIAHRVTQKLQPRMILADEVGLGKTIEAGLIIKELRARGLVERVLVVCPANLQHQWQQELRSKFNEDFEILDGAALKFLGRKSPNPWRARDNVITSLTLAQNPKRAERIIEAEWDLVVFDEAHRVRRSRQSANSVNVTQAYRLADELKELVDGLLLLTATPMQLHASELYSLVELVEPGLYPTFDSFGSLKVRLPELNDLMRALKGWEALSELERERALARHRDLLLELGGDGDALVGRESREAVMDAVAERHPLAQVLVRNRKAEVGGFTRRDARTVQVTLSDEELDLYADLTDYIRTGYNRAQAQKRYAVGFLMVTYQKMLASSSYAIRQSLRRRVAKLRAELADARAEVGDPLSAQAVAALAEAEELSASVAEAEAAEGRSEALEAEILELDRLIARLGQARDSKAEQLLLALEPIFQADGGEKVLIFTQFIETQDFLSRTLEMNGYSVANFNGQMSLDQKEMNVRRFRDPEGAQVLVSTEAGGEGRNFQFAHILVNYDLPWNPMKVEQRIGRLDRIGQTRPVFIYNLACTDTVEERVLELLATRIRLFEESVGSLDPILGEVETRIERIVMSDIERFDELLDDFEVSLEQQVREAREKEHTMADFAMDRASLRRDVANELLERSPLARSDDLERFVAAAVDYFGGTSMQHAEGGVVLSLSPRLATQLRQRTSTVRGVFSPSEALRLEELEFFAFGHELIDRIVELPLQPNGAFSPVKAGIRRASDVTEPSIEVFYEIRVGGLRPSGRIIRHVIGPDLLPRAHDVVSLPTGSSGVPTVEKIPAWAPEAVAASRDAFARTLSELQRRSSLENGAIKEEERDRARRIHEYRRVRLDKIADEQRERIRALESSGTESQRRIVPALEGRLAKALERRERLEIEHEQELERIASREASVDAEIIAAGVAVP